MILLACSVKSAIRIDEITPSAPLSNLDFGYLRYLKGLKTPNASPDYPGTFVFSKDALTSSAGKMRFFRSTGEQSFPHSGEMTWPRFSNMGAIHAQLYGPSSMVLSSRGSYDPTYNAMLGVRQVIQYDAGTDTYTTSGTQGAFYCKLNLMMVGDNIYSRYRNGQAYEGLARQDLTTGSTGFVALAVTIEQLSNLPTFPDDTALVIADWRVGMQVDGIVYFFKDNGSSLGPLVSVTVADFKPRFATIDSSVTCDVNGCDVLVTESSAGSCKVTKVQFGDLATAAPTITIKFSVDITALQMVSKPAMIPNKSLFVVAGATAFHLYKIEASAFVKDNTFVSPTYTDMVDSSLAVGELNQSLYPDSVSIMALFKVASGPDKYNVKLFNLKIGCHGSCLTCQAGNLEVCTQCMPDFIDYMSLCTLCPQSDSSKALIVENGSPVCVDRTSNTYKGFGLVTSKTFRLIEKCTVLDCVECMPNKDSCTTCKTDYIAYLSVCTLCPASDANNAIVVQKGSPVCVDKTLDAYKEFGLVAGQSFRLIEPCSVSDCGSCSENKDTCTTCKEGYIKYLNMCTQCDSPADPNKAIVVESNTPQCVSTNNDPYTSGFRVVSSEPFKLIEACTVGGCSTCQDVKSTCTACKTGFILYMNKCTECEAAKAIVVQQGAPLCVDQTAEPFNNGYRVVSTDPFRLIEACTVTDCSTCTDLKSTCTACKTGFVLYQNKCTECDSTQSILMQEAGPICVDHKTPPYNSGYRQDTSVSDFRLIEACSVTDCDTCPDLKSTCTACKPDHVLHQNKCTLCNAAPESNFAIYVKDSNSVECVATDSGLYASGFGLDTSISTFRLIDKCSVTDCESCAANKEICIACKADHVFYLKKCTLCPQSNPSKAIVVLADNSPKCVDVMEGPYSTGYRTDTSVTEFKLIEACKVPNCSTCPASPSICTTCASTYVLSADSLTCTPKSAPSSPSPVQPSLVTKPAFTTRFDSPRNSLAIFHNQGSSVQITKVVAVDLESGKTYSCEQVGCKHSANAEKITFTFDSQIQILQGELHINIQSSNPAHTGRRLQSEMSEITVTDFVLLKSNALSAWVTTLQLLIWLLRTVGCIWLFPSHPRIAMLPDYTVTLCAVVSVILGPVIPGFDTVVQAIGQVKILWYWFANPFIGWDRHTESCTPRPGHGLAGVYCSFLDNYGQNTIGLFAMLTLILLLDWTCRVALSRQKASGRTLVLLQKYQQNFGLKFWLAKLQANQLEILMYVLISYSLADSSSKSVVGLVLASLHLAFMIGTATMATALNFKAAKYSAPSGQMAASTMSERSLTAVRHLLEPSLCKVSEVAYHKARSFWPAVHLARDLAFCILALNHISDPVTLYLIVAAVQLCYTGYQGVFWYHRLVLERLGGLAVDGTFLVLLLLKAVTASTRVTSATRVDVMSPLLISVLGLIFLKIVVLGVLTFFKKADQPAPVKTAPPVKLQLVVTEADGLLVEKKVDHHQREQVNSHPKFEEEIDMANQEFSIPEEGPGFEHSPQGIHISENSLEIPNEYNVPHTEA